MKLKFFVFIIITFVSMQLSAAPKKVKPSFKADLYISTQTNLEEAVMKLLPKKSKLAHSITEGVFGPADGTKGPNINVVYRTAGKNPEIMILTPVEAGKYKKIKPVALNFGGKNNVEVQSVFFDQADKDASRELFILCYITGKKESFYATAIFDWNGKEFKRVSKIEPKLKGAYPAINVRRTLRTIPGLQ